MGKYSNKKKTSYCDNIQLRFVSKEILQVIIGLVDLIYSITDVDMNCNCLAEKIYKFKKLAVEVIPETDNAKWNFPNWDACKSCCIYL